MVKIRLARFGKKKQPTYRIIATQARAKRNTMALEYLGSYNPFDKKNKIQYKKDRIQYWLDNGAQPTYTVKSLLIIDGFMKADIKKRPITKKSATKPEKKAVKTQPAEPKAKAEAKSEVPIEAESEDKTPLVSETKVTSTKESKKDA